MSGFELGSYFSQAFAETGVPHVSLVNLPTYLLYLKIFELLDNVHNDDSSLHI
jgi:hypothetical protein